MSDRQAMRQAAETAIHTAEQWASLDKDDLVLQDACSTIREQGKNVLALCDAADAELLLMNVHTAPFPQAFHNEPL